MLPPGALLINVSRGAVVDQAALIAALSDGRLAGAGLDVFDPEPLPDDHPLLRLPNVILTPHIASYTADGARAMHIGVAQQVVQLLRGERPPHIVNPEVQGRSAAVGHRGHRGRSAAVGHSVLCPYRRMIISNNRLR